MHVHVVDATCDRRRRRSPSARRRPAPATRSAVSGCEARHRNAFPDLARPELAKDRRGAADVIGIAVRQREIVEPADARRRAAPARRRDRRCRTQLTAPSPPASTSSVRPRGKATNAESPCPTSMNVTCRRPSPRRGERASTAPQESRWRRAVRQDDGCALPDRCADSVQAAASARVVHAADPQRGRRDPVRDERRKPHEVRRPHEASGAGMRDPADRRRAAVETTRRAARPPCRRSARRAISGIARKFSASPAKVTREKTPRRPETAAPRWRPMPRTSRAAGLEQCAGRGRPARARRNDENGERGAEREEERRIGD